MSLWRTVAVRARSGDERWRCVAAGTADAYEHGFVKPGRHPFIGLWLAQTLSGMSLRAC